MGTTWYHASRELQTLAVLCWARLGRPHCCPRPSISNSLYLVCRVTRTAFNLSHTACSPYPSWYDTTLTGPQFLDALSICLLRDMQLPNNPQEAALDGWQVGQFHKSVPTATKTPTPGRTETSPENKGGLNLETLLNAAAEAEQSTLNHKQLPCTQEFQPWSWVPGLLFLVRNSSLRPKYYGTRLPLRRFSWV
jgi:hypothetical protein